MSDPKIVIPFTVPAASVLTLDTVSYTIATFDSNTRVVRIPVMLTISKPAGVAYALTRGLPQSAENAATQAREVIDRVGVADFSNKAFIHGGNAWLVVREASGTTGKGSAAFWIPADRLLQTTAESALVVKPLNDGRHYATGQATFVIRSTVPLATGDQPLNGRIYFEEYSIP